MFDHDASIELLAGEIHDEDKFYQLTREAESDYWLEHDRHVLPDGLESIPPGPYLSAIAASVDRTKLNGHDAVRLMKAEARLSSHHDAGKLATMVEVAYSPAGDSDAPVERSADEVEYAAFEIGSALTLTRRAAEREPRRYLARSIGWHWPSSATRSHEPSTSSGPTSSSTCCWAATRASAPIVVLSISMLT